VLVPDVLVASDLSVRKRVHLITEESGIILFVFNW
jgi:hypothetical protein